MTVSAIAWTIVALMFARALLLYAAWDETETLPMQWSLNGEPAWFAARGVALGFMPVLAVLVLAAVPLVSRRADPGGQMLAIAIALFAIQALHLYLARRHVWR